MRKWSGQTLTKVREATIILYGSYGYTGRLIAKECIKKNLNVILAGRSKEALQQQSAETGFPFEVLDVANNTSLRALLSKGKVVIHCAGPFRHTAKAMADACVETKTHYTDITGEYQVFELLADYDQKAKAAGITIMPGTGFDVVPSDCLALHLKNRLPSATHLQLAFTMSKGGLSRGTKKSMVEGLGEAGQIRVNRKLINLALGEKSMEVDFGVFKTPTLCIPWGDIATAWRSTGIPNIEVYTGVTSRMIKNVKRIKYINWLLKKRWVKRFLLKRIDNQKTGPSDEKRESGRSFLWGKVWDDAGTQVESRLETLSGYALTARTSVLIAEKIISGNFKSGYQSPAMAYGADLVLEIAGTQRTDVSIS
ncbi:MAG: saccharopine dehydrogenase NADP-binding domain-containing protein [Cytophagales bacterium]|nr:saccharopine dehydrogenase NADP-binding domain-containing protein [Cytophagales bacterium]